MEEFEEKAKELTSQVDFLDREEKKSYYAALISAMMWGKKIDRENRKLLFLRMSKNFQIKKVQYNGTDVIA